VLEEGDEIHFTHRILEQIGDRSYGIEVARLAGLPPEVLEKALIYFSRSDGGEEIDLSRKIEIVRGPNEGAKILERLREINPESLTPLEALVLLSNIRKELN
jgi:DNA mismatch repair protein MutS